MAEVVYTRLAKKIIKDAQTGKFLMKGAFVSLPWVQAPLAFVVAVYWHGMAGETFRQSLALTDEAGSILDKTPAMECRLDTHGAAIGPGIFYAVFPRPRRYHICIYQNDACVERISFDVIEVEHISCKITSYYGPVYLPM
ncbi:MAG TPA: hypothetical protein VGK56_19765 [Anaerolineales bacterium]